MKKKILILLGSLFVVAIGVFTTTVLSELYKIQNVEKVVEDFNKSVNQFDGEKYVELLCPKDIIDEYVWHGNMSKKEFAEEISKYMERSLMKYDEKRFDWDIKEIEHLDNLNKLKSDLEEIEHIEIHDLNSFVNAIDDSYGDYGVKADDIKNAYAVSVETSAEIAGIQEYQTNIFIVYEYSGEWYIGYGSF